MNLTYKGSPIKIEEVDFEGEKLKYFVTFDTSEYGTYYQTHFFRETFRTIKKKFWSRKQYEVEEPIILFNVPQNAYDAMLSKEWWRDRLQKDMERLKRKQELENGILI